MLDHLSVSKLNLGCGDRVEKMFPRPWLNVDLNSPHADLQYDARALPTEWRGVFFEVRASHILEHCFLKEWAAIVNEWCRVLRPGGLLRIVVPDLDVVSKCLREGLDMKGRQSYSWKETTPVLAQIFGIGYDSPETDERWRHRMIVNGPLLVDFLNSLDLFSKVSVYSQTSDPAAFYSIKDDSQNPFSVHIVAQLKAPASPVMSPSLVDTEGCRVIQNDLGQLLSVQSPSGWRLLRQEETYDEDVPHLNCMKAYLLPQEFVALNQTSARFACQLSEVRA